MTITRSSAGVRTTVVHRNDRVIVAHSGGYGYVQRPYTVRNQVFVQRTYYVNRVAYVNVYRPYVYRGLTLHVYAPVHYYHPAFYGWVYSPWRVPVRYHWGWMGSPWYGYYGPYFAPYPVYPSPVFWLTDFLFSATLEAAYQERMAAAAEAQANAAYSSGPYGGQTTLTPEVKQAIANEVQQQLAQERQQAQNPQGDPNGAPSLFTGGSHVFVVSRSLDVPDVTAGGQECSVTEGDVLQSNGAPSNADAVNVTVLASKGRGCRKGSVVSVLVQDLIEMQNQMRATVDRGMEDLRSRQGQGGIPALPAGAGAAPVQASYAAAAPPPDPNVGNELREQAQEARQAEQEVVNQASAQGGAGPARIGLGQTIDQVTTTLGEPGKIVDLGAKKMYVYADMKVIFTDGKVSDVQ